MDEHQSELEEVGYRTEEGVENQDGPGEAGEDQG